MYSGIIRYIALSFTRVEKLIPWQTPFPFPGLSYFYTSMTFGMESSH